MKRITRKQILTGLCVLLCSVTVWAGEITSMNIERNGQRLKVVVDGGAKVRHFALKDPHRAVLDFTSTRKRVSLPRIKKNNMIARLRGGEKGDDYRLVVDLKQAAMIRVHESRSRSSNRTMFIIDLISGTQRAETSVKKIKSKATSSKKSSKGIMSKFRFSKKKRNVLIAIDAGHGGKDPGAIAQSGVKEKDVVLRIAKKLEKLIDDEAGFYSKSIRHKDVYVELKTRSDVARSKKADLFVSIHADAFPDRSVKGASIYVLSHKGASSATAKFLAEKENEKGGLGRASLAGTDALLKEVLVDLSMNDKMSESVSVGQSILKKMGSITKLHSSRVESAAFAVLKTPDVPSVLIETGFISNQAEAKQLSSDAFQDKMAAAIFAGIKHYFIHNPPENSYLAGKYK
ncbi:MAG: N-acetylmuramoyl-L-alanine amidase [Pseudomonadota bacterium]